MLETGNGNMTIYEERTHMTFWAALKSPLIIGADLSKLSNASLGVLKSEGIIAVSQDPLGQAAAFLPDLSVEHEKQVWAGPLSGERTVVLVLNEGSNSSKITFSMGEIPGLDANKTYSIQELWSGERSTGEGSLEVTLESHETKVFTFQ